MIEDNENAERQWVFDCYFSHTWGEANETHNQVTQIARQVQDAGLRVWHDDWNLRGDIVQDMLQGLRGTASVIVVITEAYIQKVENLSSFSSREFRAAMTKGVDCIIPIVLERELLNANAWGLTTVGFNLNGRLFLDFSSPEAIQANFPRLIEMIQERSQLPRPVDEYNI